MKRTPRTWVTPVAILTVLVVFGGGCSTPPKGDGATKSIMPPPPDTAAVVPSGSETPPGAAAAPAGADDAAVMKSFAGKLSAYVDKQAREMGFSNARNVALASCVFAREMNCLSGQPALSPTPDMALPKEPVPASLKNVVGNVGGQVLTGTEAWKLVRKSALQADHKVEGMSLETYDHVLAWALSEQDMAALHAIRERNGYWAAVQKTLEAVPASS